MEQLRNVEPDRLTRKKEELAGTWQAICDMYPYKDSMSHGHTKYLTNSSSLSFSVDEKPDEKHRVF